MLFYLSNFLFLPKIKKGFDRLKEKLINGEDVNAYLSKSSIIANSVDGMLDNFGIKHFHLGEMVKNDFIERTGEIALGLVTDSEVFLLLVNSMEKDMEIFGMKKMF